ncbi:MAG: class I SAM-dependent methyltransferase [Candidatus Pacearchaeota archaeon]|nr:class I SAM-dependent methyltransferase [Candidatus Pacearchaeota archaeon]
MQTKIKEIPNQEEVWDELAESWNERRKDQGLGVLKFMQNLKGSLLDLGCGSGRHLIENEHITFYLVDFSQKMLDLAEKRARELKIKYKMFKKDVSDISFFEDDLFDGALYIATLHCLTTKEKREKSLRELYRVLKPKAQAFIAVWNRNHPKFKRFKNKKEILLAWLYQGKRNLRYYYFYDKEELKEDLEKIGFKILKIKDDPKETGLSFLVEKP